MRGGARPGAGRKPDPALSRLHALFNARINDDQWGDLIFWLYEQARGGNVRAAQLLLRYGFGSVDAPRDLPAPAADAAPNPDARPAPVEAPRRIARGYRFRF